MQWVAQVGSCITVWVISRFNDRAAQISRRIPLDPNGSKWKFQLKINIQHNKDTFHFLFFSYVWYFAQIHSTGRKQNTFFLGRTHGSLAPTGFYRPVSTFSPSAFKLPHTCVRWCNFRLRTVLRSLLTPGHFCIVWNAVVFASEWFVRVADS